MSAFIARLLASKLLVKIGKAVVIALLKKYSKQPDNKISDEIVEAVIDALE